jgi:hypothetical protein
MEVVSTMTLVLRQRVVCVNYCISAAAIANVAAAATACAVFD